MTLLISFALLLALPRTAVSIEITDDLGQKIELKEPARRIIPLYGAFAEMLYDIGAGPEVVARTTADQFPPEIVELPSVGTHMRPNVEMILALKPDLVIQSESRRQATGEMERIRDAGIPIAVFAPESFEGIFSVMKRLGTLTGRESAAQESVDRLEGRLDKVAKRLSGVKKPLRVFFEVRAEPLTGGGRESIVQNILTAAGAENTVKSDKAIVQYNFESLMMSDPDVYIIQRGPMNPNPSDPRRRTHFDRLRSVREGRVIFVDEFLYSRPGPRSVNAVEELAAALYPDLF